MDSTKGRHTGSTDGDGSGTGCDRDVAVRSRTLGQEATPTPPHDVDFDRISAAIGSLLLLWASIEEAAKKGTETLVGSRPKPAHGIAATIRTWEDAVRATSPEPSLAEPIAEVLRQKLREPLMIRNGICHGLSGISASQDGAPALLRWRSGNGVGEITWDGLQAMFMELSRMRRALDTLSGMVARRRNDGHFDRLGDTAENRGWWAAEFGFAITSK